MLSLCVVGLALTLGIGAVEEKKPALPSEPVPARVTRDAIGTPILFGKPTQGATAAIHLGRTNLGFGQPLLFSLHIRNPSTSGPYANLHFGMNELIPRNLQIKLVDANGKAVPFTLVGFGYSSGLAGTLASFRLDPKGNDAIGCCWKPGVYRLSGRIGFPADEAKPGAFKDEIVTNTVDISFTKQGKWPPDTEQEKKTRARVKDYIGLLGDRDGRARDAAEKKLKEESEPVVVLELAEALSRARGDAKDRLQRILSARTSSVEQALMIGSEMHATEAFLWAGGLKPEDAEIAHRYLASGGNCSLELWHALRMKYGTVSVPQGRELTQKESEQLVKALSDKQPGVRIQALRGIPSTANGEVREAAAELLLDSFLYVPRMMPCIPIPIHPVAEVARDKMSDLGKEAVGPMIKVCRKRMEEADKHWPGLYHTLEKLARFAPDETTRLFFEEVSRSQNANLRGTAIHHLGAWGSKSAAFMRNLLGNDKEDSGLRGKAILFLSQHGSAETDGPVMAQLLKDGPPALHPMAATGIGALKYKTGAGVLEKAARDLKASYETRIYAIRSLMAVMERKVWEKVMLDLAQDGKGGNIQGDIMSMLGGYGVKDGIPVLLAALDHKDSHVRELANRGLCAFTGVHSGVGYDYLKPNASVWKEYFKKHPVK